MAGRIPQHFIDELLTRVDIVEVIDARVPLKKRGREHIACCPFHNEKTPSFTVSPEKQFYHCFGCGAHGTALGFLMEYEHLDFVEAVETLAQSLGLEVPREGPETAPRPQHDDLYALMEAAAEFYRRQLKQSPEAIEYLKQRGLTGQTAADFGLGFAPDTWDALLNQLGGTTAGPQLTKAGLVIQKDRGGFYDRFRSRIMFPIRDRRGRVIAFGGRIIGQGEPKYLNSPETPLFHKGRELYGLHEARKASTRLERILVVEGYMDVIALAQHGIRNAVATLGTATTHEHLERLFRVVRTIVFCFDGDRAGRQAAWRALETALPVIHDGVEAYFLFLPEGEDPDTLVRQLGREAFESEVDNAMGLSDFLMRGLREGHNTTSKEGRARLAESAKSLLKDLTPGLLREQILKDLGALLALDVDRLSQYFAAPAEAPPPQATRRLDKGQQVRVTPVRLAIALLLVHPSLAQSVAEPKTLADLDLPGIPLLVQVLEILRAEPHLNAASLIERWRGREEQRYLLKLMQMPLPETDEATNQREFLDTVNRLLEKRNEQRTEWLLHKARSTGLEPQEKTELQRLLDAKGAANSADLSSK